MKKLSESLSKMSKSKLLLNSISTVTVVLLITLFVCLAFGVYGTFVVEEGHVVWELSEDVLRNVVNYDSSRVYQYAVRGYEMPLLMIIPFILGISQFAFLTNRKKCLNELSLPVKRKNMFNYRYILPLILMVISLLIVKIPVLKIYFNYGITSFEVIKGWLINIISDFQLLFTSFTLGVVGCVICSSVAEAVAFGVAIPVSFYAVPLLPALVSEATLRGNERYIPDYVFDFIHYFISPFYHDVGINYYARKISSDYCGTDTSHRHLWHTFIFIVITAVATFLIKMHFEKKFKPENSGLRGSNKKAFLFTCIVVSIITSFYIGYIAWEYKPWWLSGELLICILIILGFIAPLVYGCAVSLSFRNIKSIVLSGAVTAALVAVVAVVMSTGIFGIYNRIPDVSDIKSVAIDLSCGNYILGDGYLRTLNDYDCYESGDRVEFTRIEDIEACTKIHKAVIDNKKKETSSDFYIEYYLKDGTCIYREYSNIPEKAIKEMEALWDSPEVRELYELYIFPEEDKVKLDYENTKVNIVSKYGIQTDVKDMITEKDFNKIRKAYLKDIKKLTADEWHNSDAEYLGEINVLAKFIFNDKYDALYYDDEYTAMPVRVDMDNTIKALNDTGVYEKLLLSAEIGDAFICDFEEVYDEIPRGYYFGYRTAYPEDLKKLPVEEIKDIADVKELLKGAYRHCTIENAEEVLFVRYNIKEQKEPIYYLYLIK